MFMFNTAAILETRPHHEMYLGNESFVLVETGMSDNGDGNARTAMITVTTTLHVHHSLLCISSPSLHDYNVKVPNFTLCEHKSTFFCFSEL